MLRYFDCSQSSRDLLNYGRIFACNSASLITSTTGYFPRKRVGVVPATANNKSYGFYIGGCYLSGGQLFTHSVRDYTLDNLHTSKARKFGDHDCEHIKLDAAILSPSRMSDWLNISDQLNDDLTRLRLVSKSPVSNDAIKAKFGFREEQVLLPRMEKGTYPFYPSDACIPFNWCTTFDTGVEYDMDLNQVEHYLPMVLMSPYKTSDSYDMNNDSYTPMAYGFDLPAAFDLYRFGYKIRSQCKEIKSVSGKGRFYFTLNTIVSKLHWIGGPCYSYYKAIREHEGYAYDYAAYLVQDFVDSDGKRQLNYFSLPAAMDAEYAGSSYRKYVDRSGVVHVLGSEDLCDIYNRFTPPWKDIDFEAARFLAVYASKFSTHIYRKDAPWYYSDKVTVRKDPGITQPEFAAAREFLRVQMHDFYLSLPDISSDDLGLLAYEATKQIQHLDINSIAYLKDLPELITLLKSLASVIKGVSSPLSTLGNLLNPKTWADLYLEYRYGLRLTIADTKEIITRVKSMQVETRKLLSTYSFVNSRKIISSRTSAYKIYYRPIQQDVLAFLKKLQDWDIYPTSANLWDLIPFSFVVDWFVDVGTLLDKCDTVNYWQYLDILMCTWSVKDVTFPKYASGPVPGQNIFIDRAKYTRYIRVTQARPHLPSFDLNSSSDLSSTHILDAQAIIVGMR